MTLAVRHPGIVRKTVYQQAARLPVDIYSTDEELVLTASIPGAEPDSIQVTVEDQILTIKGESAPLDETVRYIVSERYHGSFIRSLQLNVPVNVDAIEASYDNGLLTVILPKAEEIKPKVIKVQAQ